MTYHCPMHPQYTSDKPGDCPVCGMRLVLVEQKDTTTPVTGQASVQIGADRQQLIGVKLAAVEIRELLQTVRASARVAYDPGLYSALLEHREAVQSLRRSEEAGREEFQEEARSLVRASSLRLRQMGLSDEQIKRAADPSFDASRLLLGVPGEKILVYIDVFDYEARLVKAGQTVRLSATALPGRAFSGKVQSIDTVVNPETRTLRVRAEVPNEHGELKPDMYLSATIEIPVGRRLAVPDTAVIDTGDRKIVYVAREAGHYEPREVMLGRQAGGYYEVVSGLEEKEQVVSSGNFLIDSESRIKAAAQGNGK